MRALIAIVVVLLLMAVTALAVLWLTPPRTAPIAAGNPHASQWQRVAGAVAIGAGAYSGGAAGARAGTDLAAGAGWL